MTTLDERCEEMRNRPRETFHEHMMGFLDERSQRGRLARCLLHHVREGDWSPTTVTVSALVRADLPWWLPVLAGEFQRFAGGELIDTTALAAAVPERKLLGSPVWKFRPEGAPFRGVQRQGLRFGATIRINGRDRWLGTFDTETEAASAFDSARRAHGAGGTLNFRTSLDAKPAIISLKVAA